MPCFEILVADDDDDHAPVINIYELLTKVDFSIEALSGILFPNEAFGTHVDLLRKNYRHKPRKT